MNPSHTSDVSPEVGSPRVNFRVPPQVLDSWKAECAERRITLTTLLWEKLGLYAPKGVMPHDPEHPVSGDRAMTPSRLLGDPATPEHAICKHPADRRRKVVGAFWECKDCEFRKV